MGKNTEKKAKRRANGPREAHERNVLRNARRSRTH